jgi:C4-dicarboxylate-specific signal transduction histidine kinase
VHISQYLRKLELGGNEGALQLRRTRYRKHQDELEVLVSSINQMRSKIELSYSQVNAMNEDLENKVQQKTQLILEQRQQLEYAAKMAALGEMAGGMAHEINTPLATSQIHVQIISRKQEEGQLTPETLGPSLEGLKRALDRIAIVVQGLRFFSKDGAQDSMTLNDLSSIVEKSIGLFREKIANLGIRLKVEGPSVEVFCRPEDISKVLLSLLFNARDAVANCPDKWIHVEWSFENDRICLSVTDSGPGIPPENRDKIFQPFFTTKDLNMGTGLGLSIAKGLVESQQGELELDLNSRQTKFVIRLHTPYSLKVA